MSTLGNTALALPPMNRRIFDAGNVCSTSGLDAITPVSIDTVSCAGGPATLRVPNASASPPPCPLPRQRPVSSSLVLNNKERTHHRMAHQEHRRVRELLPHMSHPPLHVAQLRTPRRPSIPAVPCMLVLGGLVESGAPEAALVVCEDSDATRGVYGVRPLVPPDVLCEAVHEEQDGAWGAGGGVGAGVEVCAAGSWEPGFGEGGVGGGGGSGGLGGGGHHWVGSSARESLGVFETKI